MCRSMVSGWHGMDPLDPKGTPMHQLSPLCLRELLGQSQHPASAMLTCAKCLGMKLCTDILNLEPMGWSDCHHWFFLWWVQNVPWVTVHNPTNSALEGDILLLKVCLQQMGTHLMIQLTNIIVGVTLIGHPTRETRRCPYTHFIILGSPGKRPPLTLGLMGPKCGLCPWQTLLPFIRLQPYHGVQPFACPWHPVATSRKDPLTYLGPGEGFGSLPLA